MIVDILMYDNNPLVEDFVSIQPLVDNDWMIDMKGGYCFEFAIMVDKELMPHPTIPGYFVNPWILSNPRVNIDVMKIRISVDIPGEGITLYDFLIDERSEEIESNGSRFKVWGRSKQALLSKRFCRSISDLEETEYRVDDPSSHIWQNNKTTAYAIVDFVIAEYAYFPENPIEINWEVDDYPVFIGTFAAQNWAPIDVIKRIADTVGAALVAEVNGSLTIKKFETEKPDIEPIVVSYSDEDDIISLSEKEINSEGCSSVLIYGFNDVKEPEVPGDDPEEDLNAGKTFMTVIRKPGDTGETLVDQIHTIRMYYYQGKKEYSYGMGAVSLQANVDFLDILHSHGYEIFQGKMGIKSITEKITLTYGQGNTSMPNINGNTLIDNPDYYNTTRHIIEVTYNVFYRDYAVRSPSRQQVDLDFFFTDSLSFVSYDFFALDCWYDRHDLCYAKADCEAKNGYWWGGKCHDEPNPPQIFAEIIDKQPYYKKNDSVEIEAYYYHYSADDDTELIGVRGVGDDDTIIHNKYLAGLSSQSDNVPLVFGTGDLVLFDNEGIRTIFISEYADTPEINYTHGYSVLKAYFTLIPTSAGMKSFSVLWADRSASFTVEYDCAECDAAHMELCINEYDCTEAGGHWVDDECRYDPPIPEYPQIVTIRRWFSKAILVGADVWIDDVYIGLSDANGQVTTDPQPVGSSHDVKFTHPAISDSDDDNFENDHYVAAAP